MGKAPGQTNSGKPTFQWLPQLDQLLLLGIQHGGAVKHDVINKTIRAGRGALTRKECWDRIRHLRRKMQAASGESQRPATRIRRKPASEAGATGQPWTTPEEEKLLTWTGYDPVEKIAQRLGRTPEAIRSHLGCLGISAKVKDGWSLTGLRELLRVSYAKLRQFIGQGWLRVRDPRIPGSSLLAFADEQRTLLGAPVADQVRSQVNEKALYTWERTAELLGTSIAQVQAWIGTGELKVADTFITERSFQDFCKKYGSQVSFPLIDPDTREWLAEGFGLRMQTEVTVNLTKHVLQVRECKCGRKIAGNCYFRHIKSCNVVAISARGTKPCNDNRPRAWPASQSA